jgi:hypothetical protein
MNATGEFDGLDGNRVGGELSHLGQGAASMEEVADRLVRHLYDSLVAQPDESDDSGTSRRQRACALVRLYKTHAYRDLPVTLMDFVDTAMGGPPPHMGLKCLTLLGTAGDEDDWNRRDASRGHQAIPLVSAELLRARVPMVARLIEQMGVDAQQVINPANPVIPVNPVKAGSADLTLILNRQEHKYDVFYVPEAKGSPYIPAQEQFVLRYGIRSVVGFGGVLPSGDLFAVILFSRMFVPRAMAEEFASLALPVKIALLPFTFRNVFTSTNSANNSVHAP